MHFETSGKKLHYFQSDFASLLLTFYFITKFSAILEIQSSIATKMSFFNATCELFYYLS